MFDLRSGEILGGCSAVGAGSLALSRRIELRHYPARSRIDGVTRSRYEGAPPDARRRPRLVSRAALPAVSRGDHGDLGHRVHAVRLAAHLDRRARAGVGTAVPHSVATRARAAA